MNKERELAEESLGSKLLDAPTTGCQCNPPGASKDGYGIARA